MFQVAGALPGIVEQWQEATLYQEIVVAGCDKYPEPATVLLRPRKANPTGSELRDTRFVESCLIRQRGRLMF
jgi:hypothetical protein